MQFLYQLKHLVLSLPHKEIETLRKNTDKAPVLNSYSNKDLYYAK